MKTAFAFAALLVMALAAAPAVEARAGPPQNCIQIYWELDLGPYTVVRRGCDTTLRPNGSPTDPCSWRPAVC